MYKKSQSRFLVLASIMAFAAAPALAATLGSTQVVSGLKVVSVYKNYDGAIYVTFTPANLAGCNSSNGGYLTSTWAEVIGTSPTDVDAGKMQLAMLLAAKAQDYSLEVRYRVNSAGTGWNKCAIDAISLL